MTDGWGSASGGWGKTETVQSTGWGDTTDVGGGDAVVEGGGWGADTQKEETKKENVDKSDAPPSNGFGRGQGREEGRASSFGRGNRGGLREDYERRQLGLEVNVNREQQAQGNQNRRTSFDYGNRDDRNVQQSSFGRGRPQTQLNGGSSFGAKLGWKGGPISSQGGETANNTRIFGNQRRDDSSNGDAIRDANQQRATQWQQRKDRSASRGRVEANKPTSLGSNLATDHQFARPLTPERIRQLQNNLQASNTSTTDNTALAKTILVLANLPDASDERWARCDLRTLVNNNATPPRSMEENVVELHYEKNDLFAFFKLSTAEAANRAFENLNGFNLFGRKIIAGLVPMQILKWEKAIENGVGSGVGVNNVGNQPAKNNVANHQPMNNTFANQPSIIQQPQQNVHTVPSQSQTLPNKPAAMPVTQLQPGTNTLPPPLPSAATNTSPPSKPATQPSTEELLEWAEDNDSWDKPTVKKNANKPGAATNQTSTATNQAGANRGGFGSGNRGARFGGTEDHSYARNENKVFTNQTGRGGGGNFRDNNGQNSGNSFDRTNTFGNQNSRDASASQRQEPNADNNRKPFGRGGYGSNAGGDRGGGSFGNNRGGFGSNRGSFGNEGGNRGGFGRGDGGFGASRYGTNASRERDGQSNGENIGKNEGRKNNEQGNSSSWGRPPAQNGQQNPRGNFGGTERTPAPVLQSGQPEMGVESLDNPPSKVIYITNLHAEIRNRAFVDFVIRMGLDVVDCLVDRYQSGNPYMLVEMRNAKAAGDGLEKLRDVEFMGKKLVSMFSVKTSIKMNQAAVREIRQQKRINSTDNNGSQNENLPSGRPSLGSTGSFEDATQKVNGPEKTKAEEKEVVGEPKVEEVVESKEPQPDEEALTTEELTDEVVPTTEESESTVETESIKQEEEEDMEVKVKEEQETAKPKTEEKEGENQPEQNVETEKSKESKESATGAKVEGSSDSSQAEKESPKKVVPDDKPEEVSANVVGVEQLVVEEKEDGNSPTPQEQPDEDSGRSSAETAHHSPSSATSDKVESTAQAEADEKVTETNEEEQQPFEEDGPPVF